MAAREHGDMPLGARPFLPQFADSRPVARPKRQIFQAGGEIREPEAEAFDPSAHLVARADTMRRRGDREAVLFDKTVRARDTLAGTGFGGASVRLDATSGAGDRKSVV